MKTLITPKFRVSFPHIFEAHSAFDGQPKKFSLSMLFDVDAIGKDPKQQKMWTEFKALLATAAREKWGDKIPKPLKGPLRDGAEKEDLEGYGQGVIFVNASTKRRPAIVDGKLQRIIDPEDFYAGCYAVAKVNAFTWSKMGKSGVSFGLISLQKVADGEPLGGAVSKPEEDFDALEDLGGEGSGANAEVDEEIFG